MFFSILPISCLPIIIIIVVVILILAVFVDHQNLHSSEMYVVDHNRMIFVNEQNRLFIIYQKVMYKYRLVSFSIIIVNNINKNFVINSAVHIVHFALYNRLHQRVNINELRAKVIHHRVNIRYLHHHSHHRHLQSHVHHHHQQWTLRKKSVQQKRHGIDQRRRLSCDLPVPIIPHPYYGSLTRSVCDQSTSLSAKLTTFSRTMSDTLCDQFSELNVEAIENDSLVQPFILSNNRHRPSLRVPSVQQQPLFTITKDYRSSRASFSVKRGDCVYVLKQVGRACFLVRKHNNGQIGFLPRALMVPTTRIDAFLGMHGYRETVI